MRSLCSIVLLAVLSSAQAQQVWTLEQCVARAEAHNLTVQNAALDLDLAEKNEDRSKWDLLPDLNGVATHGYNYGRVIDPFTNTFATDRVRSNNFYLSSNLSIFEGLRKQNTMKQAAIDADAADKGLEASKNNVRLEVVRAFLDVLGLREGITASEAQAANTREQIERTQALVEGGRVARAELLTLQSQLAQEEYTVTDLRNQHDQRMFALGRAMQLNSTELRTFDISAPLITETLVVEPTADTDTVLANVLANNPAYAQAELRAKSAERSIAIARSGAMPSLYVNGSAGTGYSGLNYQSVGEPIVGAPEPVGFTGSGELVYLPNVSYNSELVPFGDQLDQNFNKSVGLTLNVPLFNRMGNRFAIDQARVRQEQMRNTMLSIRNDLQGNVLDALVMQRSAHRQYVAASKAVEAGELALEYAEERFTQGVITSIELSSAKTRLNRSTADLINAKYQYLMASKYLDILQGIPVTL